LRIAGMYNGAPLGRG